MTTHWLTPQQTADRTGKSVHTIMDYCRKGTLTAVKDLRGRWIIVNDEKIPLIKRYMKHDKPQPVANIDQPDASLYHITSYEGARNLASAIVLSAIEENDLEALEGPWVKGLAIWLGIDPDAYDDYVTEWVLLGKRP